MTDVNDTALFETNSDDNLGEIDPKITPTVEEYLETIHNLNTEGKPAIGARLAERLNVRAASVVGMVSTLKKSDYVVQNDHTKELTLTPKGEKVAVSLARRHRLMERFLVDILQLDWEEAHEEACRLEHHISPLVERALTDYLHNPTTCPHGNPIPGSGAVINPNSRTLDSFEVGREVVVNRIGEDAEHEPGLLKYLEDHKIMPDHTLQVKQITPFDGSYILTNSDGKEVMLGKKVAGKIWVVAK